MRKQSKLCPERKVIFHRAFAQAAERDFTASCNDEPITPTLNVT